MNRHHPYGSGSYDGSSYKRGGSSGGPGPDRYHHRGGSRGRGFGRGRGSYHHSGGYDNGPTNNNSTYDQASQQSDIGPYNNYGALSQDSLYQIGTGSYGGSTTSAQFNTANTSDGYNQGYGNYEGSVTVAAFNVERVKTVSSLLLVW
ncbi:hypothetical protein ID866_7367 [Astraeus odoratus]|nr:hypothetical protein ID866_7367 [Astraeus odoratus]